MAYPSADAIQKALSLVTNSESAIYMKQTFENKKMPAEMKAPIVGVLAEVEKYWQMVDAAAQNPWAGESILVKPEQRYIEGLLQQQNLSNVDMFNAKPLAIKFNLNTSSPFSWETSYGGERLSEEQLTKTANAFSQWLIGQDLRVDGQSQQVLDAKNNVVSPEAFQEKLQHPSNGLQAFLQQALNTNQVSVNASIEKPESNVGLR